MGYKFNPLIFSGLDVSGSGGTTSLWKSPVQSETDLPTTDATGSVRIVLDTDKVYVYDGDAGKWIDSEVVVDSFAALATNEGIEITTVDEVVGSNTIVRRKIAVTPADGTHPGAVTTGAQSFSGDKTFNNDVTVTNDITVGVDAHVVGSLQVDVDAVIEGDLTVNGTTTSINTTNLEVEDKNITINKNGNDISAEGAGLTVERDLVNGSLVYDKDVESKWKLGNEGVEVEIVDVSSTQTLTNKNLDADSNTVTNLENDNIKAAAAIDASKLADGSVSNEELQYINSVTSNVQDQIDSKINLTEKAAANGVATLDGSGLIPENQLPDLAKISVAIVADEAEMLALTAQQGDHALRLDTNFTYILKNNDPTLAANWQYLAAGADSVNGLKGNVTLTTTQINEGTNQYYTESRFTTSLSTKTTDNVTEGSTNLYFTEARVQVASVTDSPVGDETTKAASVRASREYTDSQESVTFVESAGSNIMLNLPNDYNANKAAKVIVYVGINATTSLYEMFELNLLHNGTSWIFSETALGDSTSVTFDVTAAGQLNYSSGTYTGFTSGEMKVKVIPLI